MLTARVLIQAINLIRPNLLLSVHGLLQRSPPVACWKMSTDLQSEEMLHFLRSDKLSSSSSLVIGDYHSVVKCEYWVGFGC